MGGGEGQDLGTSPRKERWVRKDQPLRLVTLSNKKEINWWTKGNTGEKAEGQET